MGFKFVAAFECMLSSLSTFYCFREKQKAVWYETGRDKAVS